MEVLVVVIMKNGIRSPGLPPRRLEIYSGMVDDPMVISVKTDTSEGCCNKDKLFLICGCMAKNCRMWKVATFT
jgi:hypothetical protein